MASIIHILLAEDNLRLKYDCESQPQSNIPNIQEAIIDENTWLRVQKLRNKKRRPPKQVGRVWFPAWYIALTVALNCIYEDNVNGKISDDRYSRMAPEYESEPKTPEQLAATSQEQILKTEKQSLSQITA